MSKETLVINWRFRESSYSSRVSYSGRGAPGFPPPQKLSLFYMIMMLCDGSDL